MQESAPADRILVTRARAGDGAAFSMLVRRYARAAFAVALSVLGNRADAEDICQDAWVRALERIEDCRDPDRFAGWVLQIVRNRALNHVQYRRVRAADPLEEAYGVGGPPERDEPDRGLQRAELGARLEEALGRLTDAQREVLVLHDLAEWSHHEIAESLGISENLSRQRLFQARVRMRRLLEGSGRSA